MDRRQWQGRKEWKTERKRERERRRVRKKKNERIVEKRKERDGVNGALFSLGIGA